MQMMKICVMNFEILISITLVTKNQKFLVSDLSQNWCVRSCLYAGLTHQFWDKSETKWVAERLHRNVSIACHFRVGCPILGFSNFRSVFQCRWWKYSLWILKFWFPDENNLQLPLTLLVLSFENVHCRSEWFSSDLGWASVPTSIHFQHLASLRRLFIMTWRTQKTKKIILHGLACIANCAHFSQR